MQRIRFNSLIGLKVLLVWGVFYWHTFLPKCNFDLGARVCELFFIISGFLVANKFYKSNIECNISTSFEYFRQKFIQFYPVHIFTLIIFILLFQPFDIVKVLFNILLIKSWAVDPGITYSYNGLSWYLSSILFCYFLAPMLFYFTKCEMIKKLSIIFLITLFLRITIEILPITITNYDLWTFNYHTNPFIRSFEFFLGMITFSIYIQSKKYFDKYICSTKSLLLFGIIEITYSVLLMLVWFNTSYIRGFYVPLGCILVYLLAFNLGVLSKILGIKFFNFLYSYQLAFFMLHIAIIYLLLRFLPIKNYNNEYAYYFFSFIIVYFVSYIYTKYLNPRLVFILKKILAIFHL